MQTNVTQRTARHADNPSIQLRVPLERRAQSSDHPLLSSQRICVRVSRRSLSDVCLTLFSPINTVLYTNIHRSKPRPLLTLGSSPPRGFGRERERGRNPGVNANSAPWLHAPRAGAPIDSLAAPVRVAAMDERCIRPQSRAENRAIQDRRSPGPRRLAPTMNRLQRTARLSHSRHTSTQRP